MHDTFEYEQSNWSADKLGLRQKRFFSPSQKIIFAAVGSLYVKVNLKINLGPKVSNHPIAALQYLNNGKESKWKFTNYWNSYFQKGLPEELEKMN